MPTAGGSLIDFQHCEICIMNVKNPERSVRVERINVLEVGEIMPPEDAKDIVYQKIGRLFVIT